jgi:hypothetical protein
MSALVSSVEAPTGSVALVFTDIQGSTQLWERCGSVMRAALEVHDRLLRSLLADSSGYEVKTQGDSFMVAFPAVGEAVRWCLETQWRLLHAPWPEEILAEPEAAEVRGTCGLVQRGLRVRMGIHLGEPECRIDERTGRADYFGRMVNVAARPVRSSMRHSGSPRCTPMRTRSPRCTSPLVPLTSAASGSARISSGQDACSSRHWASRHQRTAASTVGKATMNESPCVFTS